jgi:hypothetical protein
MGPAVKAPGVVDSGNVYALLDHEGVTVRMEPSDRVAVAVYAVVEPVRT